MSYYIFTPNRLLPMNISSSSQSVTDARLEACTFYDNYLFLSSPAVPEQVRAELAGLSGHCAQGLVTGSITASSGGGYVYRAVYYDARGREAASREVRPTGTVITRHVSYNFSGTPKEIIQEVKTPKGQRLTSLTEHVYSCHTGLPTETYLTLDGGERHRTASLSYDAVGRIAGNVRGGNAGSVTYGYSMRGLPEVISSPQFTEWLSYDGGPGTPLYGGDISSMRWKTGDGNIVRGYIFSYDGMGRLVSGAYGEGDNIADNAGKYTETVTGYTLNGAITGLLRCGRRNDGTFGTVDELEVELEGNRAVNVTDRAGNMIYNGSSDFRDRNGAEPEYTYDGCGALTSDINGDIQAVEYDDAGMPRRIRFGSGSVTEYAYSATGQKLGVTHRTAIRDIAVSRDTLIMEEPVLQLEDMMPARTDGAGMVSRGTRDYGQVSPGRMMLEENTEYAGDFILKDGMPYMLLFDGGFCLYKQAAATGSTPEFFFYTKDHLGSNRTVVSEAGELVQVTHYYPFGGVFGDEGMDAGMQPYKYNGKELDHMHGLDRYDYGARMFAPAMPLWNTMDPMCEEYYHTSPYAYCMNNPVNNIDPDGKKIVLANGSTPSFIENYNYTVNFLREKGCSYFIDKLEASKHIYTIRESHNSLNYFDWTLREISWASTMGLITPYTILSPATILNHEFDHAVQFEDNPMLFKENIKILDDNNEHADYHTEEDYRVINGSERKTAEKLGEIEIGGKTRDGHSGIPIRTKNSISNEPLNKLEEFIIEKDK